MHGIGLSMRASALICLAVLLVNVPIRGGQQAEPKQVAASPADARLDALKASIELEIDGLAGLTQQMVDTLFSFAEPGFQEVETARYCGDILRKN
jgi:aminobenzoyl-glutamate utilization protein B